MAVRKFNLHYISKGLGLAPLYHCGREFRFSKGKVVHTDTLP